METMRILLAEMGGTLSKRHFLVLTHLNYEKKTSLKALLAKINSSVLYL